MSKFRLLKMVVQKFQEKNQSTLQSLTILSCFNLLKNKILRSSSMNEPKFTCKTQLKLDLIFKQNRSKWTSIRMPFWKPNRTKAIKMRN